MNYIETNILEDAMSNREEKAKEKIRTMSRRERESLTRACWQVCDWIAEVDVEDDVREGKILYSASDQA